MSFDLGSFSAGTVVGVVALYLLLRFFVREYLIEKGKNLATKEDIAGITEEIVGNSGSGLNR